MDDELINEIAQHIMEENEDTSYQEAVDMAIRVINKEEYDE
jgi:hypothetical protein